jgi:hypothetical protein
VRLRFCNWRTEKVAASFQILYVRFHGHGGESRVIKWRDRYYALGAGSSDTVTFYRDLDDPEVLYVLTENHGLGYLGLDRLSEKCSVYPYKVYVEGEGKSDWGYPEIVEDGVEYLDASSEGFFTQSPKEIKEEGESLLEMAGHNVVRYLEEYLPC